MNTPAPNSAPNSSFSTKLPFLQLGIDSTSLGEFKTCPRKYYYSIILGYQPRAESVHLKFGLLIHQARETYDRAKPTEGHEGALDSALDQALRATWNRELNRPWSSDHPQKNRLTLIQTLVWYLDEIASEDPLETIQLANGSPAVELSFRFDSGLTSITDEPIQFCGHLDRIALFNGDPYIVDIKTTLHQLKPDYFKQYSPGNQFSMYTLAGQVAFQIPVKGLLVDGIQVGSTFVRFQRGLIHRDQATMDEWLVDTAWWIQQMSKCAEEAEKCTQIQHESSAAYPQNDKSCTMWGGCPFQPVCSRPPAARETWLKRDFAKRVWDPLVARGEI